ncbi:hypothetical protein NPIL_514051 [Nephila pilipes]|uniref:Uncharacterized protein n=1 Tax=Nephila pilipes TaxID=299642 RepID=A0A8X6TR09_NEPPI|nr:hypothetical protein NPIL_514051 [Nephila pilipes]
MTSVPVLLYELSSRLSQVEPNLYRRSFEPYDQMLYYRTVLEPNTCYPIPTGTHYILMIIQKIVYTLDVVPETILPTLAKWLLPGRFQKGKALPPKSVQASSSDTSSSTCRGNTCQHLSQQKTFCGSSRPRDGFRDPPTTETAAAVFVPQPVYPSPSEPVVVTQPETMLSSPPPALMLTTPPAPVIVSLQLESVFTIPPNEPMFTTPS